MHISFDLWEVMHKSRQVVAICLWFTVSDLVAIYFPLKGLSTYYIPYLFLQDSKLNRNLIKCVVYVFWKISKHDIWVSSVLDVRLRKQIVCRLFWILLYSLFLLQIKKYLQNHKKRFLCKSEFTQITICHS